MSDDVVRVSVPQIVESTPARKKPPALGRGLGALLGEVRREEPLVPSTTSPAPATLSGLASLPIATIEPHPEQPRRHFDEAALDELAASIAARGVIQPVIVRPHGPGRYQLVAGERRWRAAQRAELKKIPAVVKEVSDEKVLELALVENIQRQELNPIEEAKAFRQLIDNIGLTQEELSERIGKSRTVIATFMRFLKLPNDIQKLLEEEKISAGHARALLMTEDVSIQRSVARKILEEGISVREAEKAVKSGGATGAKKTVEDKKKLKDSLDPNLKLAETKLRRHLGTNVRIVPNSQKVGGKLEIEYYSEMDLDRIYNLILKQ